MIIICAFLSRHKVITLEAMAPLVRCFIKICIIRLPGSLKNYQLTHFEYYCSRKWISDSRCRMMETARGVVGSWAISDSRRFYTQSWVFYGGWGWVVSVNINVIYIFSEECVGLCEEMGLQPISELFTTDGGWAQVCRQRVPDDGGCNMEAPLAEPGPLPGISMSQRSAERRCARPEMSATGTQTSLK